MWSALDGLGDVDPYNMKGLLGFLQNVPDSMARTLFDPETINTHLDHFAAAQQDDGGWTFNWPAWSPLGEMEWRGSLTVDALVLLRANGRL